MSEQSTVLPFPHFDRPRVRVTLWEGPRPPAEDALRAELAEGGYQAVKWSNEPATGYPPHAHIYPETLWVVSGSLTLILPAEERLIELLPGDRAAVPQGVLHGTMAGADGAVYLLATR